MPKDNHDGTPAAESEEKVTPLVNAYNTLGGAPMDVVMSIARFLDISDLMTIASLQRANYNYFFRTTPFLKLIEGWYEDLVKHCVSALKGMRDSSIYSSESNDVLLMGARFIARLCGVRDLYCLTNEKFNAIRKGNSFVMRDRNVLLINLSNGDACFVYFGLVDSFQFNMNLPENGLALLNGLSDENRTVSNNQPEEKDFVGRLIMQARVKRQHPLHMNSYEKSRDLISYVTGTLIYIILYEQDKRGLNESTYRGAIPPYPYLQWINLWAILHVHTHNAIAPLTAIEKLGQMVLNRELPFSAAMLDFKKHPRFRLPATTVPLSLSLNQLGLLRRTFVYHQIPATKSEINVAEFKMNNGFESLELFFKAQKVIIVLLQNYVKKEKESLFASTAIIVRLERFTRRVQRARNKRELLDLISTEPTRGRYNFMYAMGCQTSGFFGSRVLRQSFIDLLKQATGMLCGSIPLPNTATLVSSRQGPL